MPKGAASTVFIILIFARVSFGTHVVVMWHVVAMGASKFSWPVHLVTWRLGGAVTNFVRSHVCEVG